LSLDSTLQGTPSISFTIPAGQGLKGIGFPLFYVQSATNTGTVTLTATATDWASGSVPVNLTPSGFVLHSVNGYGAAFSMLTSSPDATITALAVQLNPNTFAPEAFQSVSGGTSVTMSVNSSDPTVGTIVQPTVTFNGGDSTKNVNFH